MLNRLEKICVLINFKLKKQAYFHDVRIKRSQYFLLYSNMLYIFMKTIYLKITL